MEICCVVPGRLEILREELEILREETISVPEGPLNLARHFSGG